jgi:hypothetical protein
MINWKDLKENDLIYRIKVSRYGDHVLEFTTHKFLGIQEYENFYSIFYFDDNREHHSSGWDKKVDEHFLSFSVLKENFDTSFGLNNSHYNDIEFYSDKKALLDRLNDMKVQKNTELKTIDDIIKDI